MAGVYRRQRVKHKFEARSPAELTLQKGDIIRVWKDVKGEWPDMENWVTGQSESTRQRGEFPGNYTVFVEEVDPEDMPPPLPAKPDQNGPSPPPVPARHSSEPPSMFTRQAPPVSPRIAPESRGPPQPEPRGYYQQEPRGFLQSEPRDYSQSEPQGYPEPRGYPQPEPRGYPQPEPRGYPQPEPRGYPQPELRGYPQPEPRGYPQPEPQGYPQPELQGYPQPEPRSSRPPGPRSFSQSEGWAYPQPDVARAGSFNHNFVEQSCTHPVKCAASKLAVFKLICPYICYRYIYYKLAYDIMTLGGDFIWGQGVTCLFCVG